MRGQGHREQPAKQLRLGPGCGLAGIPEGMDPFQHSGSQREKRSRGQLRIAQTFDADRANSASPCVQTSNPDPRTCILAVSAGGICCPDLILEGFVNHVCAVDFCFGRVEQANRPKIKNILKQLDRACARCLFRIQGQ
jgi:hypothetical protein